MLNRCSFIGNLGRDPEIRSMANGKEVANLSIGVTEKWKDSSGERQERTEWVKISVFNEGLIGVIKSYIKKGSKIYIEGKLSTKKYTDKDGVEKYSTEVVLSGYGGTLIMLDGKRQETSTDAAYSMAKDALSGSEQRAPSGTIDDDLIPF